jgi:hypothetical protein
MVVPKSRTSVRYGWPISSNIQRAMRPRDIGFIKDEFIGHLTSLVWINVPGKLLIGPSTIDHSERRAPLTTPVQLFALNDLC